MHGRPGPLTEVDVLGVRFPHSTEFKDDSELHFPNDRVDIVLAEAKRKKIEALNGPWSCQEKGALDYVLKRVGVVPADQVRELTATLYTKRNAEIDGYRIRVVCFADTISEELRKEGVSFIPWAQALTFIQERFAENTKLKEDHQAWDDFGKHLWTSLTNGPVDPEAFFHGWDTRSRHTID